MQKILLLLLCASIGILLASTWYFHASIYWKLGTANLHQPTDFTDYTIGTHSAPQLVYAAIGDSLTAGVGVE